jgi:hypothetical protein
MDAELRRVAGRLRLRVNGEDRAPLFFGLPRPESDAGLDSFCAAGFRVLLFPATADFHLYGLADPCWTAPGTYDHTPLLERMRRAWERCPDLLFLPRISTCSPPWWDAAHPGELVQWKHANRDHPLEHGAVKNEVPSCASTLWREASLRNCAALVRAIEASPFADRVIGYLPCALTSEEWFHHGTVEGYRGDHNPAMLAAFEDWREKSSPKRSGPQPPLVELPTIESRDRSAAYRLRDPQDDREAIDYEAFLSDLVADQLLATARTLRETASGKRVIGAFYGYLAELSFHHPGLREGGHLAWDRVLDAPELDFVASPASYWRRRGGAGVTMEMTPGASPRRRGKAWFLEVDQRTHLAPRTASHEPAADEAEAEARVERDLGFGLGQADGLWIFDMGGDWYEAPALRRMLRRAQERAERVAHTPRGPAPDTALVIDPESFRAMPGFLLQWRAMTSEQIFELARSGLSYEVITTEDLLRGRCDHRLLVMANHLSIPSDRRPRLRAALEARKRSVVWVGAPGISDGERLGLDLSEEITGMKMRLRSASGANRTVATLEESCRNLIWGSPHWRECSPCIADPDVLPLGRFADSDEISLAARQSPQGLRYFAATPALPAPLLRALARRAGIGVSRDERDDQIVRDPAFTMRHVRDTPWGDHDVGRTLWTEQDLDAMSRLQDAPIRQR